MKALLCGCALLVLSGCAFASSPIFKIGSTLSTGKTVVDVVCHPKPFTTCMYQTEDKRWHHEKELETQ